VFDPAILSGWSKIFKNEWGIGLK
jgi:hypothetical protein